MMLVKTKLAPSTIHGIRCFADEFISKGSPTSKFLPGFDQRFTRGELEELPKLAQIYLAKYAYLSNKSNLYVLSADDDYSLSEDLHNENNILFEFFHKYNLTDEIDPRFKLSRDIK